MDAADSAWLCTQAIASVDDQSDDDKERSNNYGCIVLNDMADNESYVLKEGNNTIGRHPLNDIYIEHPSVSMNHAVIQCDSDGVVLLDKGSLNKTKLNKKNLKKNVAYFLDENVLLIFGEVRANYYVDGEPSKITNEIKANALIDTTEQNIETHCFSTSNLSTTIITSNNSTSKIKIDNLQTTTGSKCTKNTLGDMHLELNSSSPSDELLLDAVSQIESMESYGKTSEIVHNMPREDTPSPVMDLGSSLSPDKINTETIREDTPSPVMNLGLYDDSENRLSIIETNNHDIHSVNESRNKVDELNETQCLEVDNSILECFTQNTLNENVRIPKPSYSNVQSDTKKLDIFDECTQQSVIDNRDIFNHPNIKQSQSVSQKQNISKNNFSVLHDDDDDIFTSLNDEDFFNCPTQKLSVPKKINSITTVTSTVHEEITQKFQLPQLADKVSNTFKTEPTSISDDDLTQVPEINDDDFFNCPTKKVLISKKTNVKEKLPSDIHEMETQKFSEIVELKPNASKTYSFGLHDDRTQAPELDDDDFFNCPTQKVSFCKKLNVKKKSPSNIHEMETQQFSQLVVLKPNASKTYTSSLHEDLTQAPEINDNDFFHCPTQKVSMSKKINLKEKLPSNLHVMETQLPQIGDSRPNASKTYSSGLQNDETQAPEIDDDDFFNCPTQKVSFSKKLNVKEKLPSNIHEMETQQFSQLNQPKPNTSSSHDDLTQAPEMNEDDFFNCPTKKVLITKKINETEKLSSNIHEIETQIGESKPITSKTCSSGLHDDLTQAPEINDNDLFNCNTQKVSISKKTNVKEKLPSNIHEMETQQFSQIGDSKPSASKTYSSGLHDDLTQAPETKENDFFNCPTQLVSISKKININEKLPSTIHKKVTQIQSQLAEPKHNTSKMCSSSLHDDLTQAPETNDDDFFNCPTQKVSFCKKLNVKEKLPTNIHEEETQKLLQLGEKEPNASKTCISNLHNDKTQASELDDDDFFNCPTQKVSFCKKLNVKEKLPTNIHEEETQKLLQLGEKEPNASKTCISNLHDDKTQGPELDDDDFFNCPTQKLSLTKRINVKGKLPFTIPEKETQKLSLLGEPKPNDSKTCLSNLHDDKTLAPELDDDDFFNCPTQKLSVSKKLNLKGKVPSTIHEEETQKLSQLCESKPSTSKICTSSIRDNLTQILNLIDDDDDFFNCPTQKVSICKKLNVKGKLSSTVHEEDTQKLSQLIQIKPSISTSCSTSTHDDLTQAPEVDNDNFFDCPTQKLTISKNISLIPNVSSSIHEKETKKLSNFSDSKPNTSKMCTSNTPNDLTRSYKMNNEDFFNCPAQRVSFSPIRTKKNVSTLNINKADTQELVLSSNSKMFISKVNSPNGKKQNKENNSINYNEDEPEESIFNNYGKSHHFKSNCISGKPKVLHLDHISGKHTSINQKRTVIPEEHTVRKSMRIGSNTTNKLSGQLPIICNQNQIVSKSPRNNKKPLISVRKDLQKPCSDSLNKKSPNKKNNNITATANKNNDLPSCSKTIINNENDLKVVSVKEEPLTDNSIENYVSSIQFKHQMKQMNETVFSPSNLSNINTSNLTSEQHSVSVNAMNNVDSNSEQSTSSNVASIWQSFWNKKIIASQNQGKCGKQENVKRTNNTMMRKERYQTRAFTRNESVIELNKKRKQDGVNVNESNKRKCHDNRNALIESTSETVVTFSYLKNRHLQEMKQFVDKTGGYVTDEITECTVLITDKIRCTMKILSAIARGCPIVDSNWLKHSYNVKMFQDVNDFIIMDKDAERKYKFKLKESLAKARTSRLLEDYTVMVTPSVKPGPKDMKVIITCAGGDYVMNWPKTRAQKELIVTCDQDRKRWKPIWNNDTALIIDSDTLVMSIIRQKLIVQS